MGADKKSSGARSGSQQQDRKLQAAGQHLGQASSGSADGDAADPQPASDQKGLAEDSSISGARRLESGSESTHTGHAGLAAEAGQGGFSLAAVLQKPLGVAGLVHLLCLLRLSPAGVLGQHGLGLPQSSGSHAFQPVSTSTASTLVGSCLQACVAGLAYLATKPRVLWQHFSGSYSRGPTVQQQRVHACARTAVSLALLTMHCTWLLVVNWAFAFALLWLAGPLIFASMLWLLRPQSHALGSSTGCEAEASRPGATWSCRQACLVGGAACLPGLWVHSGWTAQGVPSLPGSTLGWVWPWLVATLAPVILC